MIKYEIKKERKIISKCRIKSLSTITVVITTPYDNDTPIDDPNLNYLIETSTIALLAKKAKRSALNN